MYPDHAAERRDTVAVVAASALIIVNAFLYLLSRKQTFVLIDAIAHVNKARGIFDNFTPGVRQLGTVWLPLPHILMAPLAAIDSATYHVEFAVDLFKLHF